MRKLAFSAVPEQSLDGVGSQLVTCSGIQTTGKRLELPPVHKRGRFTPATPRPSLQLQRTFRSLSHAHTHTRASAEPRPDDCGGRYVLESSITGGSLQPNLVCPNVQGTLPASQAEVGQAGWRAYRPRRGLLLHLEGYQSHGTATIRTRLRISKGRACRGFRRGRIPPACPALKLETVGGSGEEPHLVLCRRLVFWLR